ncbi:DsbA family protein [Xanthobacter sp. TB0139]|uniref:DsbA family protein n=1 Tax=Xanthobacter sp. TB0139 TaxID=3459178 RepID=UPI004039A83D
MSIIRRRVRTGTRLFAFFALAAAALALPATPLLAAPAETVSQEKLMAPAATPLSMHALGNPEAPVTVVEYASLTCSHCADFHNEVLPKLKAKYIDTGKVYFIFREMPFDPVATAGFMLARCMPEDKYLPTVSALFETQRSWAFSNDPAAGLRAVAKQAGMNDAAFEKCLTDNELAAKVQAGSAYASKELEVRGTPTFFVNGKRVNGAIGMEAWDKELEPLLAASGTADKPAEAPKAE